MTDKESKWIKFYPSLELPKERVSIAYDTHDERGYRFSYGYFQFYNGTCGCFWKDGNEQPKVVKAEDIKYWMPVPSFDIQEEPVRIKKGCKYRCLSDMQNTDTGAISFFKDKIYSAPEDDTLISEENGWRCDTSENVSNFELVEDSVSEEQVKESLISKHEDKTCKENGKSLTQEPISDDLEEAIDTYLATYFGGEKEKQEWPFQKKMAIHFANWQKKKDDYAIEIAHMAGEEEGKNIMKQQLMAKAVDATVHSDAGGYPYIPQMELYNYEKDIPFAREGDKYKVILIKDDEK